MTTARAELKSSFQAADLFGAALGRCENGVVVLNENGVVMFWNNWMADASGLAATAVQGRELVELFPGLAGTRVQAAIDTALKRRQASILSRALNRRMFPLHRSGDGQGPGQPIEHQVVVKPLDTRDGRFCLVQILDVTDAFHRERFLKQQAATMRELAERKAADEARMRAMLEASPIGVAILGADGTIRFANRRLAEMFLAPPESVVGADVSAFFTEPAETVAALARESGAYEVQFRRRNGSFLWAQVTSEPTRFEDEDSALLWVYDISDHKRAEAALVSERDRAWQTAKAKTDFLAMISHEIRTPMNGILGTVRMLAETELDGDQLEYVDTIRYSGDTLLAIVDDVLDLTKVEAGKLNLESAPVDLRQLVENLVQMLSARAAEKQLNLTTRIADDVPRTVLGDAARLRQILLNLVGNAIKFTDEGGIEVAVETRETGADRLTLGFTVTDTGIGIPADAIDNLFAEFYQVDSSITRRFGGTGLGLAICRRLVEAMGGTIGVESEPGKGSIFRFTVVVPPAPSQHSRTASGGVESRPARSLRVLLVEDNEINQRVALNILARAGHDVTVAATGTAALDRVAETVFDVVLMDVRLPEIDGIEATRRIRADADPARAAIPIVGLTANTLAEDVALCRSAGMVQVLAKPVDPDVLVHALASAVGEGAEEDPQLSPEAGQEPVLTEPDTLRQLSEALGADRLAELIELFQDSSERTFEEMHDADSREDLEALRHLAHRLKGGALNLGFGELGAVAQELESAAQANDARRAAAALERIGGIYRRTLDAVERRGLAGVSRR